MQLQPARWDKRKPPSGSDDDDDDVHSRPSSPSLSPEHSDAADGNPRSLPPRMRLKDKKSAFEFRLIKQASATPSQSSSVASVDKELVPIPSPPWAKNRPLPQGNQVVGGSDSSSSHYFPNASTNRYYKPQLSSSSSTLPPKRASTSPYSSARHGTSQGQRHSWNSPHLVSSSVSASVTAPHPPSPFRPLPGSPEHRPTNYRYQNSEGESEVDRDDDDEAVSRGGNYRDKGKRPARSYLPPHSPLPPIQCPDSPRSYSPIPDRSFRPSPTLQPRYQYPPSQSETGPKPYHTYYRSQSFDYLPHRHHLPSISSASVSTAQKRRYASDDDGDPIAVFGRRMDVDWNGRESEMNADKRRKEDLQRDKEREKASRTLPPLPPFRPGQQGHQVLSYPGHSPRPGPPPPLGQHRNERYPENRSPPYPYPPPSRHPPPPPGPHSYHPHPPPTYHNGPPLANYPPSFRPRQQSHDNPTYPHPYPGYPPPPLPRAYGPPPQQAPPQLQPPPPKHLALPNRNGPSTANVPPLPHSQLLPSSTPHSYFHKIRLNRPRPTRSSTVTSSSQRRQQLPQQPQVHENQLPAQNSQTLYQQAAAARHAAYSSPSTVDSTMLTTHPVPYSIGVKAASSTAGMAGDAGRLVGEYEQHPLRQQTSYLPISAVGGAQFVLKPPRIPKSKASKMKFLMSVPAPTSVPSQFSGVIQMNGADAGDNFLAGNEIVAKPPVFQPNPEDVLIEIKQEEEEGVTDSVAAITIAEPNEPSGGGAAPAEENELAAPAVNGAVEMARGSCNDDVGGSTVVLSLGSPPDFMGSEANTFAAPARPSRKVKKHPCDVCGQIFTRSGDVKRHKESRHRESAGCICPYCGRVLTRQDALQRHWDKYCRNKAKRLDRRRRLGLSLDSEIEVDPVFLHPAPGHSNFAGGQDEASLGGSSGIDIRSFRTVISGDHSMLGRRTKGKQKARARVDGDGDVRMLSESESEVDELESEDPLDGYDSEGEERRRDGRDTGRVLQGAGEDEDEEVDELDDSDDDERRGGVKSDAEGVSINGDDFYSVSGESEGEDSEEEDEMDGRSDAEPMTDGDFTKPPREVVEESSGRESSRAPQAVSTASTRPEFLRHDSSSTSAYPPIDQPPFVVVHSHRTPSESPPAKDNVKDNHPPTFIDNHPHLANGQSIKQSQSISFVEFCPPPPSPDVPSNPRPPPPPASARAAVQTGPAPMSAFTSTFPAQPPHLRQPRARPEYRVRYNAPMLPPQQPTTAPPPGHGLPVALNPPPGSSLSVQVHVPPNTSASTQATTAITAARTRRGPKPRRNDFDAVLDPSQTAAQGGQIRMRVQPQATYMPPVQPALAIMHEQPHVAKRKGKRTDGLVPEYGFVPREYVYRERE